MQQFWPVMGSQHVGSVLGSHGGGGGGGGGGQLGSPMRQQVLFVQHWPVVGSGTQQVPSGNGMQQFGSPGMHGGGGGGGQLGSPMRQQFWPVAGSQQFGSPGMHVGGGQSQGGQVTLPSGLTMHGVAGHTQGHIPVVGSQGGGGGGHSHGTGGHIWPGGHGGGMGHTQQRCGSRFGSHGGGGAPGVQQPLRHCTLAPGNDGQSLSVMHWPNVPSQHCPGIGGGRHSHWPFQ